MNESRGVNSSNSPCFRGPFRRRRRLPRAVSLPWGGVLYLLALMAAPIFAPVASGQDIASRQGVANQIEARLEFGEFGPARRLALGVENRGQRDRLLGRIADVQAEAGARRASLATVGQIDSDVVRSDVLARMRRPGARGGAALADFDSLIELITSTILPDSWDEVGGPGAIQEFRNGVFVDAAGVLRQMPLAAGGQPLQEVREAAARMSENQDLRRSVAMRKISLNRLEKQVQLLAAAGRRPTEAMRHLAGLQRIQYILHYPETGDIVLAGPAGAWRTDAEGRAVSVKNARPVVQLDDLVVVLRNAFGGEGRFGCSINPRPENLARTQAFLKQSAAKPIRPSQREQWLEKLRTSVGRQDIVVDGIDPGTRAARVLVEADYRMKLVGIGLEDGVLGVTNYLDSIQLAAGESPPPQQVLRWWFTLKYDAVRTTPAGDAFELRGPGVQLLSENELLTQLGKRVHTGKSSGLNKQFSDSFTRHFEQLAAKYHIYADLRNIFDLALAAELLRAHDLPGQAGWTMPYFGSQGEYHVAVETAPTEVDSVCNHRVIRRKHVVASVSGGVSVNPRTWLTATRSVTDNYGDLKAARSGAIPQNLDRNAWWWD